MTSRLSAWTPPVFPECQGQPASLRRKRNVKAPLQTKVWQLLAWRRWPPPHPGPLSEPTPVLHPQKERWRDAWIIHICLSRAEFLACLALASDLRSQTCLFITSCPWLCFLPLPPGIGLGLPSSTSSQGWALWEGEAGTTARVSPWVQATPPQSFLELCRSHSCSPLALCLEGERESVYGLGKAQAASWALCATTTSPGCQILSRSRKTAQEPEPNNHGHILTPAALAVWGSHHSQGG